MERAAIISAAKHFAVWRAATSLEWDCTAEEISEVVKLTPKEVRHICRKRRWRLKENRAPKPGLSIEEVSRLLT